MFRLSNIIKKNSPKPAPAQDSVGQDAGSVSFPPAATCVPCAPPAACASVAPAGSASAARAKEVYEAALALCRRMYSLDAAQKISVTETIGAVIDALDSAAPDILTHALAGYDPADYLCRHAVNVCALALYLGKAAGLNHERLLELGEASLAHDVGMVKYLPLVLKKGKLGKEELKKVHRHPVEGVELLKNMLVGAGEPVYNAVLQEHERCDASGYPQAAPREAINEYARIIGIVDVYEALVHERAYRAKFSPLQAVKIMLDARAQFDRGLMKLLLDYVGIYPCGFLVRLSTKETAVVVRNNPLCPLRPVVRVVFDTAGQSVTQEKIIDLHETTIISIEQICLDTVKV